MPRPASPALWATAVIGVAALFMVGLQAWIECGARATQVATTYASLINLASALIQHADSTIEVADTAVLGTVARLQTNGASPETFAGIDQTLKAQKAVLSRLHSITVTDSEGNWVATSEEQKGENLSDRIYFQRHRDEPDLGLFISPPMKSVLGDRWIITVSRRFNSADGAFGGMVVAAIDLGYFVNQYSTYDLGPNRLVALLSTDGISLARYPPNGLFIGHNLSNARLFSELRKHRAGSYLAVAVTDDIRRYTGYRQSDRHPLVVAAAVTEQQALGAWRADALRHMLITATLAGTVGLLGLYLIRQVQRSQAAEAQFRESEARYRLLTDHAADVVTRVGPDGMRQYVSPAALRIIGVPPEALLGTQMFDFLHPDDREAALETIERLKAGETEVQVPPLRILRPDGTEVWIEPSLQVLFDPVTSAPDGYVSVLRDITRRVAVETALRESEARLRLVQQVAGIAYSDRNIGDLKMLISDEFVRLYGLRPDQKQMTVAEWLAMVHPEDRSRMLDWSNDLVERSGQSTADFRICRPDGAVRWVTIRAEIFVGPNGRPVRAIHAQRDITEIVAARDALAARQRQLEQSNADLDRVARDLAEARDRAEQANKAKTRFLAAMSHELRTPLNGILGYAHVLNIEGGLNTAQAARVNAMLAAGKHLLGMITCVLELSEIEAEHIELQDVACDVQAVAEACLDLVRPAAEAKGLALSNDIASGTPRELITDPTRLRQILLNLLGNAVKFTTHGSIQLRVLPDSDRSVLRIEVVDTGSGVPAEQRQRLFRDFERLDNITTRTAEGAGLGLALSAGLARVMGGCLAHDDNPNGGSVFWLELPLKKQAAPGPALPPPECGPDPDPVSLSTRALHVLVVDDVLMNRDIASSFLHAAGHSVTGAGGGAEAVAAAAATDFDVVLMDVQMPEIDGLEATRRIRALPNARGRVPIVALTAHAFTEQVAECRKAGMDSHLSKPFDPETLLAAVAHAVAARSQQPDPSSAPASSGDPVFGSEVPVLNAVAFKRISASLNPEAVDSYLRTIVELGNRLLLGLRNADALKSDGDALAAMAHSLAGSAGMFGFERLATVGRRFERVVETDVADVPALAEDLCKAIEATHHEIYERSF